MRYRTTPHFDRAFARFPPRIEKMFRKQIVFLLRDIRHPSLRAKKYDEAKNIWQARVTANVRFYFTIEDDCFILLDIWKHRD